MTIAPTTISPVPPSVDLTKKRLWFFYCFLGLPKALVVSATGWKLDQIDYRIRRWRLTRLDPATVDTDHYLDDLVSRSPFEDTRSLPRHEKRRLFQDELYGDFQKGEISWETIDTMPWPKAAETSERHDPALYDAFEQAWESIRDRLYRSRTPRSSATENSAQVRRDETDDLQLQ